MGDFITCENRERYTTLLSLFLDLVVDDGTGMPQLNTNASGGGTGGTGATEGTLQQVLTAIQNGQDFEAKLVTDAGGTGTTYLEVRIWNSDTSTWETPLYYLPGSNTGVAAATLTAPIVYQNPSTYLAQIAANSTPGTRSHNYLRSNGAGNIPAGSYRGSVFNAGTANGVWNGSSISPGETVPWGGVERDTYGAIVYDATGTELVIEYTT